MAGAVGLGSVGTRRPRLPRCLPEYFLPPRSGVGHLVCETFLCAVAEACITLRLREEKSGCGTHPTLLSLVTCIRKFVSVYTTASVFSNPARGPTVFTGVVAS